MALALNDRDRLKRILDLSDRLGTLRRRVKEGAAPLTAKEQTDEIRSIAGTVVSIGLPGVLGRLERDQKLSPQEVMVLLLLLNRRLEPGDGTLSGREILSTLFPSTYGILSGSSILAPGAPLRACAAMDAVQEEEDSLQSQYSLSDPLFRAVERDVIPGSAGSWTPRSYANHYEYLADLARLTSLLLRRANARFDADPFGNRLFDEPESVSLLDRRCAAFAHRVGERLERTPNRASFPLETLAARLKLDEDEQLILVALLVQECYYGNPGLEAVECVKMVSRTPEQLLRKRRLVSVQGTLRRAGLVELEDPVDEKEITAELSLPRWVSALLLGETESGVREPIGPDTRIEFHEYLEELEDSERFYRDLGG